ncbi:ABC transporter ATP-binding protein [Sphingopyxis panaciterrulae]|uniref:ABC-2 type transport system ATP-binding protein n=1 Tax=Sphingopyxis panaciterrulae TaxID=462372 RepID=A0A7W9EQU9_9SPHN|nr:ABC transporter ATP-binding protein [Sphingopyxis panaciterrulae]MBB5707052.1 ABC-2 type transport system ATP-binding protein [Sphingopyxis panaciterrulae]
MLEAIQLRKEYGSNVALKGLDLKVGAGEIYCMLGANGAGKTTTVNCFLGFIQPTGGQALINGIDVQQQPLETKKCIAYIPENVMLYRNMTGLENLRYFSKLGGHDYDEAKYRSLLDECGLQREAVEQNIDGYSKGMRQKVGIAIALAKQARAILLDEPTSGLDPKSSNEFSELLLDLKSTGVAILMVTHDLFRAKQTGTRLGIMRRGELVREMNSDQVSHAEVEQIYLEEMKY